jgi:phage gp29-like protein
MLHEPPSRAYSLWSPELLRSAEILADGGYLRLAAELCEQMLADDRIKTVVDQRTEALLGLDLSFEAGIGRLKKRAIKALEVEEDFFAAFPEEELKLLRAWALMLDVGIAEIEWTPKGDRIVPRIRTRSCRFLRWDWPSRSWRLLVARESGTTEEITIAPGDGKWIVYTPYGSLRPWVHGAYRALSRWSLLKQYAIQDWGFYSERHGQGILVAEGADGSEEQRKQVASDLQSMARNAAIALPKGFALKLLEATAKTWETFQAQIAACDNAAAVTLLGQNLTTEVNAGSRAAASVHENVALVKVRFDEETTSTLVHDQALTWWALYNFGDAELAPWPRWETAPSEDLKESASVIQMVAQGVATLQQAGLRVDVEALGARFGIPLLPPLPAPAAANAPPGAAPPEDDAGAPGSDAPPASESPPSSEDAPPDTKRSAA